MLTTLVASSKGGCGKSTLVTQLAAHWAQAGQNTAIVDAEGRMVKVHSGNDWTPAQLVADLKATPAPAH